MLEKLKPCCLKCVIVDVQHFDPSSISVLAQSNKIVISGLHPEQSDEHGFATRSFCRVYLLAEEVEPSSVSVVINPARLMLIRALDITEFMSQKLNREAYMENYTSPDNIDLLGDKLMRETMPQLHENVKQRLKDAYDAYDKNLWGEIFRWRKDPIDGDDDENTNASPDLKPVEVSIPFTKLVHDAASEQEVFEKTKTDFKRRALKRPYISDDLSFVPSTSKACEEPLFRDQDTFPGPSTSKACEEPLFKHQDTFPGPSTSKTYEEQTFVGRDFTDSSRGPLCEEPKLIEKDTSPILSRKSDEKQSKSNRDTISEWEFSAQRRNRKRSTKQPTPPEVSEHKKPREEED